MNEEGMRVEAILVTIYRNKENMCEEIDLVTDWKRIQTKILNELKKITPNPDLVFVADGSDPYEKDELESSKLIKLTKEQMLGRDLLVYHFIKEMNLPQQWVMAGGYGEFSWEIYAQFLERVIEI